MIGFYIGVVVLLVVALVFVLWPVITQRRTLAAHNDESSLRQSANVVLYRDHLADIEQSLVSGNIDQSQYQQLKAELERNLLQDSDGESSARTQAGRAWTSRIMAGIALVSVVAGFVLYERWGAYEAWQIKSALDQRLQFENQYLARGDKAAAAEVERINRELVEQLSHYVLKRPDDLAMQALLARTAMSLGNYPVAIRHFREVLEREPELAQIMAELAQAVFLQSNNRIVPIVQTLVERALAIEPNNTTALELAGISAFGQQQYQQAIDYWQQAMAQYGEGSANAQALQSGIRSAQQRLGASSAAEPAGELGGSQGVQVQVSLGSGVSLAPDDTVFIYARAWQGAKMPLSIARIKASQLPTTVTLTNAMSMAPGMNLSSAEQLELVARVSKSGSPAAQAGDWQATQGPVTLKGQQQSPKPYHLVISEQIL